LPKQTTRKALSSMTISSLASCNTKIPALHMFVYSSLSSPVPIERCISTLTSQNSPQCQLACETHHRSPPAGNCYTLALHKRPARAGGAASGPAGCETPACCAIQEVRLMHAVGICCASSNGLVNFTSMMDFHGESNCCLCKTRCCETRCFQES
jgi:hypothetical protein